MDSGDFAIAISHTILRIRFQKILESLSCKDHRRQYSPKFSVYRDRPSQSSSPSPRFPPNDTAPTAELSRPANRTLSKATTLVTLKGELPSPTP